MFIDFGVNNVPKVLDQNHCIVERNCFLSGLSVGAVRVVAVYS